MRILSVLLIFAVAGCDKPRADPPQNPAPVVSSDPIVKASPSTTEPAMPPATIEQSVIDQVLEEGGGMLVVKVTAASVDLPGTRSEAARIEADVVRSLRGNAGAKVSLRSYTSGGNKVLMPGTMYVVATFADRRFAPALDLLGHAATSEAQLEETVRLHKVMMENAPK